LRFFATLRMTGIGGLAMTPPPVIARSGSDEAIPRLVAISYQLSTSY